MLLHIKVAVTIYDTYTKGVLAVSSLGDTAALYGTGDEDNPFVDLEKIKREIRMLQLKICLTSAAEDIPQFTFNVLHYDIQNSITNCSSFVTGEEDGTGDENGHELLYLLKSTFMVSVLADCLFRVPLAALTRAASAQPHSFQLGYTITMARLLYEKVSQRKKLERRVERAKAHSANRSSFALPSPHLVLAAEEHLPLEEEE